MRFLKNKNKIAEIIINTGFIFFALFFWLPFGFYLGGNAYFFDKYEPSLILFFPYVGIAFFMIFLGNFIKGNAKNISENQILFFLFFLAGIGVMANFSRDPNFSILFLILWAIGFFSSIAKDTFYLDKKWKKLVVFIGLLLGCFFKFFTDWDISLDIIAIVAIYLAIFIRLDDLFKFRWIWISICFIFVYLSHNNGLFFLSIFLWITSIFWLSRKERLKIGIMHWIPIIMLIFLKIWNWGNSIILNNDIPSFFPIFKDWKIFFVGVGEGQYLESIYYFSPLQIVSNFPILPKWGIELTFFEQGILGILLIIILALSPLIFNRGKFLFPIFLFLSFWIVSADFLGTPNGILLALALLFVQKTK